MKNLLKKITKINNHVSSFGGIPCDMDPIMKLAKKYNLKVIEIVLMQLR